MKAAAGEMQLTVITLIALAAVVGLFWILWPQIEGVINSQWSSISDTSGAGGNQAVSGQNN